MGEQVKAITTKYVPYTNTKPARIKATDNDGHTVIVSYDKMSDGVNNLDEIHRNAAIELCKKMGWDHEHLVTGYLGEKAGFAHVWDDEGKRAKAMKDIRDVLQGHPEIATGNSKVHFAYQKAKANSPKG